MVLNLSFVCSLFMLWLNVKKKISLFTFKCWEKWKNLQKPAEVMVATTFYGTCYIIDLLWFNGKKGSFNTFLMKKSENGLTIETLFCFIGQCGHHGILDGYVERMCYPDIWIIIRILGYPDHFCYPSIQILKKLRYPNIRILNKF